MALNNMPKLYIAKFGSKYKKYDMKPRWPPVHLHSAASVNKEAGERSSSDRGPPDLPTTFPHEFHDRGGCEWKKEVGRRRPPSSKTNGW